MGLNPGARLGPYEIVAAIGAGGMGEVYRAKDTRLERTVAIKLLSAAFADRPDRRQRFQIEARAISSLQHPHICALFDVGEQDGQAFLVMEYLEGETLDDRLTRGPLPAEDVLRYASQIAGALDHAHRAEIVHRDLKPSNVMLTESGAKLLDFGLARGPALVAAAGSSTVSFARGKLTAEGTIVGTFQYMAPEQLEGRSADARTDIFAFGTLLYEMATGRRAFEGKSQASLIASILTAQPPSISTTRSARRADGLPPALDHVVERCFAKNPDERWQTTRDVKLELEWIGKRSSQTEAPVLPRRRGRWREAAAWGVAALVTVAAAAGIILSLRGGPAALLTFEVALPRGTNVAPHENRLRLAISPDGQRLAVVASNAGRSQIWVRSLRSLDVQPLAGTEGAITAFWSPDSRFIGFFADGALKKIEASGGPPRMICVTEMDGTPSWGADGTILFTQFRDGIYRVSAEGATPARVTTREAARREMNHYWPSFLPDGRHFLYMATSLDPSGVRETPSIYVASLDGKDRTLLARMHSRMVYAPPGRLLFVEEGTLLAQAFDIRDLRLRGEPVKVAEGVDYFRVLGTAGFTVSDTGVLAYQGTADTSHLVWYDRRGNTTDSGWGTQDFRSVRISPNGRSAATDITDPRTGTAAIWLYDVARGAPVRFTTLTDEGAPVWSPDGRRILFETGRAGAPDLVVRSLGESGREDVLLDNPGPLYPEDWSKDGKWIAYLTQTRYAGADQWLLPLGGDVKARPFATTRFEERDSRFSPDSKWIAFTSNESGAPEVYVAPVHEPGEKTRISVGGGTAPVWRGDGRELYYLSPDSRFVMVVPVATFSPFRAGEPARLFATGADPASRDHLRNSSFDVTPDGQRFLIGIAAGEPPSSRITVVLNWSSALDPEL